MRTKQFMQKIILGVATISLLFLQIVSDTSAHEYKMPCEPIDTSKNIIVYDQGYAPLIKIWMKESDGYYNITVDALKINFVWPTEGKDGSPCLIQHHSEDFVLVVYSWFDKKRFEDALNKAVATYMQKKKGKMPIPSVPFPKYSDRED